MTGPFRFFGQLLRQCGTGRILAQGNQQGLHPVRQATGAVIWTKTLNAPVNAPATFNGDLVYVVARDSTAWALDAATGLTRWQQSGTPSLTTFAGSAAVAVSQTCRPSRRKGSRSSTPRWVAGRRAGGQRARRGPYCLRSSIGGSSPGKTKRTQIRLR